MSNKLDGNVWQENSVYGRIRNERSLKNQEAELHPKLQAGSQSASHLAYFTGKVMRMVVPEPICDLIRTFP
jgi:hypothetical protein